MIEDKLMCKDYNFFTTEDYELFKDGKIIYRFVILEQNEAESLEVNVLFKVEDPIEGKKVTLSRPVYNKWTKDNKIYQMQEISNVPVIKLKSFVMSTEIEKFVEDAKKLHD